METERDSNGEGGNGWPNGEEGSSTEDNVGSCRKGHGGGEEGGHRDGSCS